MVGIPYTQTHEFQYLVKELKKRRDSYKTNANKNPTCALMYNTFEEVLADYEGRNPDYIVLDPDPSRTSSTLKDKLAYTLECAKEQAFIHIYDRSERGLNEASFLGEFEKLVKFYNEKVDPKRDSINFVQLPRDPGKMPPFRLSPKPQMEKRVGIQDVYVSLRIVYFFAVEGIAANFSSFGTLERLESKKDWWKLEVDPRFDIGTVVEYMKSFNN